MACGHHPNSPRESQTLIELRPLRSGLMLYGGWEAGMRRAFVGFMVATLLWAAYAAKAEPRAASNPVGYRCAYSLGKSTEMIFFHDCTWIDADGHLRLKPQHRHALAFDEFGLAEILIEGGSSPGFWYADRKGRLESVLQMDNGPDPFNDGLARSASRGRIGYVDRQFRFAIPARYDGALPFENGRAVVCVGCIERWDAHLEEGHYEGGRWGCIDVHGREVVALRPMKQGLALFANHCGT
jgi:WG containing repeat